MQQVMEFLVGTYSQPLGGMPARGEGIYSATIDLRTGALAKPRCLVRCPNPSYLAWGPGRRCLYATRELFADSGPALASFRPRAGGLEEIQSVALQGDLPCHISIDTTGQFLASAQYGGGDVAVYRLESSGGMLEPGVRIQHAGCGPNKQRQEGPHAHYAAVLSERRMLVAVDLGLDAVIGYRVDLSTGSVDSTPLFTVPAEPGSGPRHLAMLPGTDTAYVYCELSDEIVQLAFTPEGCRRVGLMRAFPPERGVDPAGAAIRVSPDGRHVYVSGRSQSSIACFAVDPVTHALAPLADIDTGGMGPRDFSITPDGSHLVVANEHSDHVTSLRRDAASGLLSATGHSLEVGSPVCILF